MQVLFSPLPLIPLSFHPLPASFRLSGPSPDACDWCLPQQLSEATAQSHTRFGPPPSCHPAFVPLGGARLPGHADGFLQAAKLDVCAQQQQGDVVVHGEPFKVVVNHYAGDTLHFQGGALQVVGSQHNAQVYGTERHRTGEGR